jgi:hypothetical protein
MITQGAALCVVLLLEVCCCFSVALVCLIALQSVVTYHPCAPGVCTPTLRTAHGNKCTRGVLACRTAVSYVSYRCSSQRGHTEVWWMCDWFTRHTWCMLCNMHGGYMVLVYRRPQCACHGMIKKNHCWLLMSGRWPDQASGRGIFKALGSPAAADVLLSDAHHQSCL